MPEENRGEGEHDEEGNPIGSVDGLTKTNSKVQIGNQNVVIVE